MNEQFNKYSNENFQFYSQYIPKHLEEVLDTSFSKLPSINILDLGCGDGAILIPLSQSPTIDEKCVIGMDISSIRIKKIARLENKNINLVIADACNLPFKNNTLNLIINSQVIEHLNNDKKFLQEIIRIMKSDANLYISTVIKRPHAFWIYRKDGIFYLDPTHVKEYPSEEEFFDLLRMFNLQVISVNIFPVKFKLLDLIIRGLVKCRLLDTNVQNIYLRHPKLNKLDFLKIPVLGYYIIECVCKRGENAWKL